MKTFYLSSLFFALFSVSTFAVESQSNSKLSTKSQNEVLDSRSKDSANEAEIKGGNIHEERFKVSPEQADGPESSPHAQINLRVTGMTCEDCAQAIKSEFMKIEGMQKVVVNVPRGLVTAFFAKDYSKQITVSALINAVKAAGFEARDANTPPSGSTSGVSSK